MPPMDDIRALFRQFRHSNWRSMHVVTGGYDLFFSRDAATQNPAEHYLSPDAADAQTRPSIALKAPHLGTVVALAPPGTQIEAQGVYGRLQVLDQEEDLVSAHAGRVVERRAEPGALVEFDEVLILLEAQ